MSALLPADGSSEGFDNIAEALGVSPSLIQGYVSAAMKISRLAVGDRTLAPSQVIYAAPPALAQDRHIEGLPLGTRGGMLVHHTFPLDAEYEFTVGGGGPGGGGAAGGTDVTIDGERVTVQNTRRFRIPVTAGPHTIGVAVAGSPARRPAWTTPIRTSARRTRRSRQAVACRTWRSSGPFNSHRHRRYAEPPADFHVPPDAWQRPGGVSTKLAGERGERSRMRAHDPLARSRGGRIAARSRRVRSTR